jgi:tetratricopeptide (TPR) repeat protein
MNLRVACLATFAILLLCISSASNAQAQGHTIRGKVRNASGVNVPRVTVNLESGNGPVVNQTVTNNEGDFAFTNLSDTSYVVTISAPDYNPASERVDFVRSVNANDPGETRTVEITLVSKTHASLARREVSFVQNVPKQANDQFLRATQALKEGRTQEAITLLQQAITIFPDYFDARYALANELVVEEKFTEAITQLDEARRINAKDDRVYQAFGMILMRQQKLPWPLASSRKLHG